MRLITALLLTQLTACAGPAILAASVTTTAATGKGLTDHAVSQTTGADCNISRFLTKRQDYYCELPRTAATTYNRTAIDR